MTNFLLDKFVKNKEDVKNSAVRMSAATLSSITGIVCNILLFGAKFLMGFISNSVSMMTDAFNNLSDCLSCVISLISFKLAAQPADKEHPFGHGRIEYLSSLVIAILIVVVGVEFIKTSVEKLISGNIVIFKTISVVALILSIIVKLWMSAFNKKLGNKYNSPSMIATASDSLSDAFTTTVIVLGYFSSLFTSFPVDGIVGIIISLIILKNGWSIIKSTLDTLLGKPADKQVINDIMEIVNKHDKVIGIHDLIVHNYGPGRMMASLHAEVDGDENIFEAHDHIDQIEKELYEQLHISTTIHLDPIDTKNELLETYKQMVLQTVQELYPEVTMHDFRMVSGTTHTNLIFDLLVPYALYKDKDQIKKEIDDKIHQSNPSLMTVITFDTQY